MLLLRSITPRITVQQDIEYPLLAHEEAEQKVFSTAERVTRESMCISESNKSPLVLTTEKKRKPSSSSILQEHCQTSSHLSQSSSETNGLKGIIVSRTGYPQEKIIRKKVRFAPLSDADDTNSVNATDSTHQESSSSTSKPSNIHNNSIDDNTITQPLQVEIISVHKPASTMTKEELSQVHWQPEDYEYFRSTARFIAAEVRNRSILQQQQTTRQSSHSYDAVMTKTYQLCMKYSNEARSMIPRANNNSKNNHIPLYPYHIMLPKAFHSMAQPRKDIKEKGKEVSMEDTAAQTQINNIHRNKCQITNGAKFNLKESERNFFLPPRLYEALIHWIKNGHSRRGLEKFSIPHLAEMRPLSRETVVNAVLVAQNFLKKQREERKQKHELTQRARPTPEKKTVSYSRRQQMWEKLEEHHRLSDLEKLGIPNEMISPALSDSEVLQIVSEQCTRASKFFALAMGYADSGAVLV